MKLCVFSPPLGAYGQRTMATNTCHCYQSAWSKSSAYKWV